MPTGLLPSVSVKRRALAISLVAAVVVVAGVAFAWPTARDRSSPVSFSTVYAAKLAQSGMFLSPPTGPTPSAAAGEAMAAAVSKRLGRKVLEYHYVHYDRFNAVPHPAHAVPRLSRDCWAVSLDPSGMSSMWGSPPQHMTYWLVMVGPKSYPLIGSVSGG